ncbi:AFG1/ZapE family ATPase [Pseudarthrobacter sp. N5]|uniref:AFG1/ZapE family ATPase n=1 Tax=Pseudarthrobacter sp. N5 TaxID=3418416 RepID=UPI003CF287E0
MRHDHFVPSIAVIKEMMEGVEIDGDSDFRRNPAPEGSADEAKGAFRLGRIISPATNSQLGAYGLFPPSSAQRRVVKPTTQPLAAKAADAGLLWISFAELCAGLTSTADYLVLAAEYRIWVIDGIPSPNHASAAGTASAWQRFSNVVDVLYDQDSTLFLLGNGPLDWGAAASGLTPARAAMPVDMARIASRLSLLGRVESLAADAGEESSGS